MTSSNNTFDWEFISAATLPLDFVPGDLHYPFIPGHQTSDQPFTKAPFRFLAVLGDLRHKEFVYTFFGSASDPIVLELLKGSNQAAYLRHRRPDLVPQPAPGQPPYSDSTLSTIFEKWYFSDPAFVREYTQFLISLTSSEEYKALKRQSRHS